MLNHLLPKLEANLSHNVLRHQLLFCFLKGDLTFSGPLSFSIRAQLVEVMQ